MINVKVAQYRQMADRLERQVRVDRHACVGAKEIAVWRDILERTTREALTLTCGRATSSDRQNFTVAVLAARMALGEIAA